MDKLVQELLILLREMLGGQRRLLQIALVRREAMRVFEIEKLNGLMEMERAELLGAAKLDEQRKALIYRFRQVLGKDVEPTVSEIAKRCGEPQKTQLLSVAAELKGVVVELDQNTRINAKVSETVVRGLAKVMKVVTGLAQHAGLYMRNGRKAAIRGIHMLEITA
jgi:FlgN protein